MQGFIFFCLSVSFRFGGKNLEKRKKGKGKRKGGRGKVKWEEGRGRGNGKGEEEREYGKRDKREEKRGTER